MAYNWAGQNPVSMAKVPGFLRTVEERRKEDSMMGYCREGITMWAGGRTPTMMWKDPDEEYKQGFIRLWMEDRPDVDG